VQGVYIPKFDFKIRKIFISLGHTPHQWDEIWRGGVDLRPNFTPPVQRVPPAGRKKLKIALLTELNNSALRAMLAIIAGRAPGRIHSNVPFNQKGSIIAEQAEEENQG